MHRLSTLALAGLALTGCADQLVSDQTIRSKTAFVLDQPASAVTISDRRYDGTAETRYVAHTGRGAYSCIIYGGALFQYGMTAPPTCAPQGKPLRAGPPWAAAANGRL